jgi:hypothetical protein
MKREKNNIILYYPRYYITESGHLEFFCVYRKEKKNRAKTCVWLIDTSPYPGLNSHRKISSDMADPLFYFLKKNIIIDNFIHSRRAGWLNLNQFSKWPPRANFLRSNRWRRCF